jgi:hypothetical protein
MAICAAGPPKAVAPSLRKRNISSLSLVLLVSHRGSGMCVPSFSGDICHIVSPSLFSDYRMLAPGLALMQFKSSLTETRHTRRMTEITFLRDLAVVMAASAVTTVLFHLLRQPVVLGYLVAGIIIGPHTPPFALIADLHTIHTLAELLKLDRLK